MRRAARHLLVALPLAAAAHAGPGIQFAGTMGAKALLVIDGQPRTLAVGESHSGVRLLAVEGAQAQVEHAGTVLTLRLGSVPVAIGGGVVPNAAAREVVLSAGPGGHFMAQGAINGRPVRFMVDTGASTVALGQAEADRLGLDWKTGARALTQTANGTVPVHRVTLTAVRLGEVTVANVPAVVVPQPMPYALLGNSFLSRFQMRRENDVMRLELRP